MRRLLASNVVMWLLVPGLSWAADGLPALSLPALLEEAQQTNPELRAAKTRWDAARLKVKQATGLPAPTIGIEWEEIPKGTIKLNKAMTMYQLIQSLPFPGKLSAKQQVAVKEAQIVAANFKQAEWELTSRVKEAYYELFLIDRELEIQEEQVRWLRQIASAAEARYATGEDAQAPVLEAQAELLEGSNMLATLAQRRLAMAAHLNHLLGRPSHHEVGRPEPVALSPLPFSPEELVLIADAQQPELLASRFALERAAAELKLAKWELLPDLETMFELRNPAMGPVGPWDLALAVTLPFWFWTKARYGVKVAVADRDSARAAAQAMQNEVQKRIHEHWHEAFAAWKTARLSLDGLLPLAEQAVASAFAAYRSGRGSVMDLLDALRRLGGRRRTYYQELVAFEQHVVMLEQASGIPLREEGR